MKLILRILVTLGLAALLTACPKTKEESALSDTLLEYDTVIRWAQWDAAVDFVAPEYLIEHPVTRGSRQVKAIQSHSIYRTFSCPG